MPIASYNKNVDSGNDTLVLEEAPRLHVDTVHSVKGGSADTVVLLSDLTWSQHRARMLTREGAEDLHRLFYVACTRARQRLVVCASSERLAYRPA